MKLDEHNTGKHILVCVLLPGAVKHILVCVLLSSAVKHILVCLLLPSAVKHILVELGKCDLCSHCLFREYAKKSQVLPTEGWKN